MCRKTFTFPCLPTHWHTLFPFSFPSYHCLRADASVFPFVLLRKVVISLVHNSLGVLQSVCTPCDHLVLKSYFVLLCLTSPIQSRPARCHALMCISKRRLRTDDQCVSSIVAIFALRQQFTNTFAWSERGASRWGAILPGNVTNGVEC